MLHAESEWELLVGGNVRSIHWRSFVKKDVFKNFAKLTGNHLCQSLFFNKFAGLKQLFTKQLRTAASEIWALEKRIERNRLSLL